MARTFIKRQFLKGMFHKTFSDKEKVFFCREGCLQAVYRGGDKSTHIER